MKRLLAFAVLLLLAEGIVAPKSGAAAQKKSKVEIFQSGCLLYGTVLTDKAFALPGAEVKVRRTNEKKAKWNGVSDRRGEFAIRVPGDGDYEITVKGKGYAPMSKTVSASAGGRQDMVFRLAPATQGKKL